MISLSDICIWTGGKLDEAGKSTSVADAEIVDAEILFTSFSFDTRTIMPGALFIALKGDTSDGHQFLKEAEKKGALAALVQKPEVGISIPQIFVPDTLKAMQDAAKAYRQKLGASFPIVAVTGSNGKTTTKNFIATVLLKKYKVAYTKASFNNHIGLPLSILSIKSDDEMAVLEIGTNNSGEIKMLADICGPTCGVITNIGVAHIENFGSKEAIAKEKGELGKALPEAAAGGFLVLPAEDEFAGTLAEMTKARVIRMSRTAEPYAALANKIKKAGMQAGNLMAEHLITDALLAAAVGYEFGISDDEIVDALANAKGEDGRFTFKKIGNFNIIDDTYNANPDSVCAAIDAMAEIYPERRKIIALGKLMEQGDFLKEGYGRIVKNAERTGAEAIIFVDINFDADTTASLKIFHVKNQQECADMIKNMYKTGDIVLLKGSKSSEMKKVLDFLA